VLFKKLKYYIWLILFALLFSTAFLLERSGVHIQKEAVGVADIEKTLIKKQEKVDKLVTDVTLMMRSNSLDEIIKNNLIDIIDIHNDGYELLIYQNDSLKFWSDNIISVSNLFSESVLSRDVVFLENGWFYTKWRSIDNIVIVGLALIKREYSFENEFIKNYYQEDFNLNPDVNITVLPVPEGVAIKGLDNKYLFSLIFSAPESIKDGWVKFIRVLYYLAVVFLLIFMFLIIADFNKRFNSNWWLLALLIDLVIIRYLLITLNFSELFFNSELFNPRIFASSSWYPNLGDLLITVIFVFTFSIAYFRYFKLSSAFAGKNKNISAVILLAIMSVTQLFFFKTNQIVYDIIVNSSVELEAYKVFEMSIYSILCYLIFGLLFVSNILIIYRTVYVFRESLSFIYYLACLALSFLVLIPFASSFENANSFFVFLDIILVLTLIIVVKNNIYLRGYIALLLIVFVSAYIVWFISEESRKKEWEKRKIIATGLATERDMVAELLLADKEKKLVNDEVLKGLLTNYEEDDQNIIKHLRNYYFNGYLSKYDFQIALCNPVINLLLNPVSKEQTNCYEYYESISKNRIPINTTHFYFVDNLNGRISYFGKVAFDLENDSLENTLFIQLDSRLIVEELGYPELLLEKKMKKSSITEKYSYAKYYKDSLINSAGEYHYSFSSDVFGKQNYEYTIINYDGFNHLLFRIDKLNTIVVSLPQKSFLDVLISLSYVIVYFYLLFALGVFVNNLNRYTTDLHFDIKSRIQISMIGILLLSLLLIGGGTVYYNIEQFKKKQNANISEKIQSVLIELEHKLGGEKKLHNTPEFYDEVLYYLMKFSYVFFTDINLYDAQGNLYASSRPEIFDKGLIGYKMNTEAYRQLVIDKRAKFIHNESIGSMEYLSAYIPFQNTNNKIIGYVNLPYFTKQSALTKDLTGLVVAIINIYVLLILLAIFFTVVISGTITKPLRLIQKKFREIKLGMANEKIKYEGRDEIADLVVEYNRMVEELARSADLLAKSERESAWREMARQIAHEIKNPLTPMKLNVQLLQRSWNDNDPNFEDKLRRLSASLIEQIDTLSSIATDFSRFAKLTNANVEEVDLILKINNAVSVFENDENAIITQNMNGIASAIVFADREHLLQVFNNLIKNAIQAIPAGRKGKVDISLEKTEKYYLVKISDNGTGIPDDLKDKLFVPNFTTKTSGMGLGLAIVKKIVEGTGGKIWFETAKDQGTTFFIEFPFNNQTT